jgi:tetratricopeptide (TPR) repeat protein
MADQEVRQLVEDGIAALKAGEATEARRLLASAIQRDPRNERAWLYLAALLPRPQAKDALEKVLAINPSNAQALKGLESFKSAVPSAPVTTANAPRPRAVPPTARPTRPGANIEELPMSGSDAPSRYTPPGGLHESMRLQKVETRPPVMQPVFIEPGYQPLEISDKPSVEVEQYEEANRLLQNIDTQSGEYSIELRDMLLAPYDEKPRRSPWGIVLGLLLLLVLIGGGIGAYFWFNQPVSEVTPTPEVAVSVPTPEAVATTVSVPDTNLAPERCTWRTSGFAGLRPNG